MLSKVIPPPPRKRKKERISGLHIGVLNNGHTVYYAQSLKVNNSGKPLDNQTWHTNNWPQQNLTKFGFRTDTTALWPIEQSSILFAKFDCPEAHLNLPVLVTVHACETLIAQYLRKCC